MLPRYVLPVFGVEMSSYGTVLGIYFALAVPLTLWTASRRAVAADVVVQAIAFGVPLGLAGARLLDMMEYSTNYHSLADVVGRRGSSIYGAFLLVLPAAWAYARWRGLAPLRLLDAGAPAMALGEALTRIGCFLNGCCYGVASSAAWAVTFPRGSFAFEDQVARGLLPPDALHAIPVCPVQLISCAVMLAVTLGLVAAATKPRLPDGTLVFAFSISYGALRLAMAPFRVEALASMMLFSVIAIATGTAGLSGTYALRAGWRPRRSVRS